MLDQYDKSQKRKKERKVEESEMSKKRRTKYL